MHRFFSQSSRRLVTAAAMVAVCAVSAGAQQWFADITGKWAMTVAGPQGANESAVVIKQEADSLSGTIESQMLGSGKVAGTVKGDSVRFAFKVAIQGMSYELKATGAVKDQNNISGSLEGPNGVANFPFTMKRVQ